MELLLFALDLDVAARAADAGLDAVVVDLERRDKAARQRGFDTDITSHTLRDLERVRALTDLPVVVRVDRPSGDLGARLRRAVDAGADEVLVPMVADVAEAAHCLDLVPHGTPLGVLVERTSAVADADAIGRLPLARVYVGLMDLMVERGAATPFEPLVDGTVDRVRSATRGPFGVAGLTTPGRGHPIPAELLAGELVRLDADFTFLRRSFLAAVDELGLVDAVARVRQMLAELRERSAADVADDRARLQQQLVVA